MNIIFMGRKKYAADMLEWTVSMGIGVKFVCTDSNENVSPVEETANKFGISINKGSL